MKTNDRLSYKGYEGNMVYDADHEVLHGAVLGIRDTVTYEGRSVKEIKSEFKASVNEYLAFCKERGREPNEPRSGNVHLRIGPDTHSYIAMLAAREGVSLNAFIASCLEDIVNSASESG